MTQEPDSREPPKPEIEELLNVEMTEQSDSQEPPKREIEQQLNVETTKPEIDEQPHDGVLYQNESQSISVHSVQTDLNPIQATVVSTLEMTEQPIIQKPEIKEDLNGGVLDQKESQSISVHSVQTDLRRVSINHTLSRDADSGNTGSDEGSSSEDSGEEGKIGKEAMLEAESSESDESSETSSTDEDEDDEDEVEDDSEDQEVAHSGEEYEEGEIKQYPAREGDFGEIKQHPARASGKKQQANRYDDGSSDDEGYKEPVRSKHELKDQPPVPQVEATLEPHHNTLPVGVISSVVGLYLVVEGNEGQQALNEGSILWLTEQRLPLGIVDEVFGPVKKPFYVVRYNEASEVPEGVKEGVHVSYVLEFSSFVLENPNLYKKGYDASGEHDEEISGAEIEFSDDEKEAEFKRSKAKTKRGNPERGSQDVDKRPQSPWNHEKRRQGGQGREIDNRRLTEEGHQKVLDSNNEHTFSRRPPRQHTTRFQNHHGQRPSRMYAGMETARGMPASMHHPEPLQLHQTGQESPLYQVPSPHQPHYPGRATQTAQMCQESPVYQRPSPHQPQYPGQATQTAQMCQESPVYQFPSPHQPHHLGPATQTARTCQESPVYQLPSPHHPQHLGQATQTAQMCQQSPIYQFPSPHQPHHLGQAGQIAHGFVMPLMNRQPQALVNTGMANGLYSAMQASAIPGPVLGVPAGPLSTSSFGYSHGPAFNQNFSPTASTVPTMTSYSGNTMPQGPPPAWGLPEQLVHMQPQVPPPPLPAQQPPPQQNPLQFPNQRGAPHQGQRFG